MEDVRSSRTNEEPSAGRGADERNPMWGTTSVGTRPSGIVLFYLVGVFHRRVMGAGTIEPKESDAQRLHGPAPIATASEALNTLSSPYRRLPLSFDQTGPEHTLGRECCALATGTMVRPSLPALC